jgi:hypothetical protein
MQLDTDTSSYEHHHLPGEVVVIGLGVALYFFGGWITSCDTFSGWEAYAP